MSTYFWGSSEVQESWVCGSSLAVDQSLSRFILIHSRFNTTWNLLHVKYCWNCFDQPALVAGSKALWTEFGIHQKIGIWPFYSVQTSVDLFIFIKVNNWTFFEFWVCFLEYVYGGCVPEALREMKYVCVRSVVVLYKFSMIPFLW